VADVDRVDPDEPGTGVAHHLGPRDVDHGGHYVHNVASGN
jgi:hypothetical protein